MLKKNNNFFSKKKEWSKIKDELLGCYLKPYFSKIINTKRPVVYIDCFAGKGKFDDGEDGSPLIALKIIDECIAIASSKVTHDISTYFIDVNYASDLKTNLPTSTDKIIINIIDGVFEEKIDEILSKHKKANVFLYIDPYGIKSLDIPKFKNILKKFKLASVEILINFNSFGFYRQACHILGFNNNEKNLIEYDDYLVNKNKEDMNKIFGSSSWEEIVCKRKNNKTTAAKDIEIMLSKEFSKNLQDDGFKYVLNIPIKSSEASIKYRMFHATNHVDGCILMANNMFLRSKSQRKKINNNKTFLIEFDIDDKIVSDEIKTKNLLSLIDNNDKIEIRELFCNYFIKFGINSDTKGLIEILKKNKDKLIIKRYPEKKIEVNQLLFGFLLMDRVYF